MTNNSQMLFSIGSELAGFSRSFSPFAIHCDKRDIEDPESSSISICVSSTSPTMFANCALMVAS